MIDVVKVGGSLYDLPDLGPRLARWLGTLEAQTFLLVPGGGAAADVVRAWDRIHQLGEERAHWLALRALTLNAHFLAGLVPSAPIVGDVGELQGLEGPAVLDAHAFALADEGRPGCLPHAWDVTSDSIAARVAALCGARRLYLCKSVDIPQAMTWEEAAGRGLVDRHFPRVRPAGLDVKAVNLRAFVYV